MTNPWLVSVSDTSNSHPLAKQVVGLLLSYHAEDAMAAKKKGARKRSNNAGLKRSTSRPRSRSTRPKADKVKAGLPEQPIDSADRAQAEGHGNQRALMTRAQEQAGSPVRSPLFQDAQPLEGKQELLGAINQLAPEAPAPREVRDLMTTFYQVTEGYAEILRYETEQYIGRVREALGSNG